MLCKNCKIELANDNGFCQDCGARVIHERISLKFLFKEFVDKVLSVDNKLLKTFIHLFTKPEEVIDSYIRGVRKRYFNPVSYLLVSITLTGIYLFFFKDIAAESFQFVGEIDPANPFANEEFGKKYYDFFMDYQAFFTALNIPVYAFISWLVFLNRKKYNFYEHIVIYLYSNSQISIISFVLFLPIFFINKELARTLFMYGSLVLILYSAYVLIRLFKLTFWQFIVKTLYFLSISLFMLIVLSIISGIAMSLFIGPEGLKKMSQDQKIRIEQQRKLDSINAAKKDSLKTKILTPQ